MDDDLISEPFPQDDGYNDVASSNACDECEPYIDLYSMPEKKHPTQNNPPNEPKNNQDHDRIETITCFFLSCWITADILVVYGHTRIAVLAFYFALIFPLYLLTYHAKKAWPAWKKYPTYIFAICFLVLPLFFFGVTYLASFSIFAESLFLPSYAIRSDSLPEIWCIHSGLDGKIEASPVYFLVYFKFKNERDSTMFVDGYSVETQTTNGNWVKMPIFNVHPIQGPVDFYFLFFPGGSASNMTNFLAGFKNARRMNFHDNYLQSRLSEKTLNPNESVQGWLMLDMPKDGWTSQMRFTIATGGEIISRPIKSGIGKTNNMDIQLHGQLSEFSFERFQDIGVLPLRYYGDETSIFAQNNK